MGVVMKKMEKYLVLLMKKTQQVLMVKVTNTVTSKVTDIAGSVITVNKIKRKNMVVDS